MDRRALLVSAGAALIAAAAGLRRARGQTGLQKLRYGFANEAISAEMANLVIPEALGYFKEEGLRVEFLPLGSAEGVLSALASGQVAFGTDVPFFEVALAAKGDRLPAVNFFEQAYPFRWDMAVRPNGRIETIGDLKGKRIGVSSFDTSDYPVARAVLSLLGIDPDKEVNWVTVADSATAGHAVMHGQLEAWFGDDAGFAQIEASGIMLRFLPLPPDVPMIGGLYLAATPDTLSAHRQWCVGFARGVAKASVFITENPEAGAYVYLKMFPEAAPRAKGIEAQVDAVLLWLRKRIPLYRSYDRSVAKAGYIAPAEWQAELKFAHAEDKIPDPSIFFTDALIDEINHFDADAIRRQARDFPLPFRKA